MARYKRGAADLQLVRDGENRRDRPLFRNADRRRVVAVGLLAAGLASTIMLQPRPLIVWNASASAPIGLYLVSSPTGIGPGDMVIAWPPDRWRAFAARRHYIPADVPLVKRAAAGPGDRVCAVGPDILINGSRRAERLRTDLHGRAMPSWHGCVALKRGAHFLLMDNPASFDGRYFGPTRQEDIIGKAWPLWAR